VKMWATALHTEMRWAGKLIVARRAQRACQQESCREPRLPHRPGIQYRTGCDSPMATARSRLLESHG